MKLLDYLSRGIEYSFYAIFLLVPLVFAGNTSELFEFNKMWVTYGLTIIIAFLWFSKMLFLRRPVFKRTVLDIPILLFLISQIASTVFSLDRYISFWGYYSRFNGGLLSVLIYIFLYYAFVSNFFNSEQNLKGTKVVMRSLLVSLVSGLLVVIWSIPSHFGYDPTCLIFRGTFDVSCWTADFQPKIRMFGPLGQPDWLAGYLGVLLPISLAFLLRELGNAKKLVGPKTIFYAVSFFLFYLSLLYSASRSGIAGSILSLIIFALVYIWLNRKNLKILKNKFIYALIGIIILTSFVAGVQLPGVNKLSFSELQKSLQKTKVEKVQSKQPEAPPTISALDSGGSSSLQIRKIVWRGALDIWKANSIFGTGVETYAFAYYKYRPIEHNRVSEWNFLYNKAHNEYLNYLATTGIVGLGTYLFFVAFFLFICAVNLFDFKIKQIRFFGVLKASEKWNRQDPLLLGLATSFLSILIINFFGFSVVILNIYLLLIPAFVLILLRLTTGEEMKLNKNASISYAQWAGSAFLALISLFLLAILVRYWLADTKYALGANYSSAGQYQVAYPLLQDAVKLRREPIFEDQLAVNDAVLAATLATQGSSQSANLIQNLASESLTTSEDLVRKHPNNIVFWKSRVRILYTLANVDPRFMPLALEAIKKTADLAPTDASILYNLGVLYGQNNDSKKAVSVLEKTVMYKPDYREAHFALAIFYHDLSVSLGGGITNTSYHQKAIEQLNYILKNLNPNDVQSKQYLSEWSKER